jgi:hypothetical protein
MRQPGYALGEEVEISWIYPEFFARHGTERDNPSERR